ncbi:endonuclease/exonuclease/phosphatase family protein [Caulobacter sp.]|uniref:endonuclease/exonuclease/phosphatase family protein n=1 Tax=Caulobacter sp. TaxID=78 RepID=UPI003BAACFD6
MRHLSRIFEPLLRLKPGTRGPQRVRRPAKPIKKRTPRTPPRVTVLVTLSCLLVILAAFSMSWVAAAWVWSADLVTLFQPWLVIAAGALMFACLIARTRLLLIASIILSANVLVMAAPWLRSLDRPPHTGRVLTVATFNILYNNTDVRPFLLWARRSTPDLIAVQEVADPWGAAFETLKDTHPYSARVVAHLSYAPIDLLSRYPIKSAEYYWIDQNRVALTAIVNVDGQDIESTILHPPSPRDPDLWRERNYYFMRVATAAGWAGHGPPPPSARMVRLALGDFNATRWSPHFQNFLRQTELYDADHSWSPRTTRVLMRYDDWVIGAPIDHVLISRGVRSLGCQAGPFLGSDHLPLTCRLEYPLAPPPRR